MLNYEDAKVKIVIQRRENLNDTREDGYIVRNVCELTSWRGDFIDEILDATQLRHLVERGDTVSVSIEIGKEANI